jgi:protein-tyrosine phosphatase
VLKSVLVVCSGNICRSPYAENLLRKSLPDLNVTSAGLIVNLSGLAGKPANSTAVQVAAESGVDLRNHKAKQLTQELVDEYDVILVMDREQLETLCSNFLCADYKAFLFSQWIGAGDIEDPYKKSALTFRLVFNEIDDAAQEWLRKL